MLGSAAVLFVSLSVCLFVIFARCRLLNDLILRPTEPWVSGYSGLGASAKLPELLRSLGFTEVPALYSVPHSFFLFEIWEISSSSLKIDSAPL